jgi:hypothetical protein
LKRRISLRAGLLPVCLFLFSSAGCDAPAPRSPIVPAEETPAPDVVEPGTEHPATEEPEHPSRPPATRPGADSDPGALFAFPGERGALEEIRVTMDGREVLLDVERIHGHAVLEGDILLALPEAGSAQKPSTGIVDTVAQQRWPGGVVPYLIDPALPNPQRVFDAINHWQQLTALRFVQRTTETRYVSFVDGAGCSSYVGMQNFAAQAITLNAACSTGSAIHEIGHAAGLWHEQSRADRDTQVRVIWENIAPGYEGNFRTYVESGLPGQDLGGYDIRSVMQYGSYAFSDVDGSGPKPTLVRAVDGTPFTVQRTGLSSGDILALDALYQGVAPSTGRTVVVKGLVGYWSDTGRNELPRDLSATAISVLVPDGAGGYGARFGTYAGDGAWVVRNIPTGTYLLKFGTGHYSTTESVLDMGYADLGRSDATVANGYSSLPDGGYLDSTYLTLHVDNLAPYTDGAILQLFSANAGAVELNLEQLLWSTPAAGATVLDSDFEYSSMDLHPLIEESRGDRAWVTQFGPNNSTLPDGGTENFQSVVRAAYLPAFTAVDRGYTAVSGTMSEPTQSFARFTWQRSSFEALAAQVAPAGIYRYTQAMGVFVVPYSGVDGNYDYSADLVVFNNTGTAGPDVTRTIPFRNPFPPAWPVLGMVSHAFTVSYPLPNNSRTLISGTVRVSDTLSAFTAKPLAPRITPVRTVTVDSTAAGAEALIAARPTIAWTAPAVGTPTSYLVQVYDVTAAAKSVASLSTRDTQVVLPSGMLTSGRRYAFRIRANLFPGQDITKAPSRSYLATSYADMLTAAKTVR